jgi:hypothetical protein
VVEKPGDIDDLALPEAQLAPLGRWRQRLGHPPPCSNRARAPYGRSWMAHEPSCSATPLGRFGGSDAAVLAGDVNQWPAPSYPRKRWRDRTLRPQRQWRAGINGPSGGYNPEWDFGFRLSYTTFAYDASLAKVHRQREGYARGIRRRQRTRGACGWRWCRPTRDS